MREKRTDMTDGAGPKRFATAIVVLLCLILVFSVIAYGAVDAGATGLLAFFLIMVLLLWLAGSLRSGELSFSTDPTQYAITGMILIGLVQLLPLGGSGGSDLGAALSVPASRTLSLDQNATRMAVIRLVEYAVYFAAALSFFSDKKQFRRVVKAVIIFGALIAVFAILQKLLNPDNIYGARQTVQASSFGPYVNSHHFAGLMEMTLGLSLGLLYGKSVKKELRVIFLLAAVLMGIALVMTGSRGGMISLLGVLGAVTIFAFLKKGERGENREAGEASNKRRKLLLTGGGLAFFLLIAGIAVLMNDSALRGLGIENNTADLSNGRTHFWYVALQIFKDNFLLGAGLDAFGVAFTKYDTWNGVFRIEQAHNDYLQVLADAGIFGLACVLGFIYFLFRQGLRVFFSTSDRFRNSVAAGALAGCFGIMIHSFFDFPLRTPANMFVFLTLAALAISEVRSKTDT
ncbi:MAG TPA: O-antigen ligase family protein [Pyrinomonadaceae bacterium]|jgi:O-antigen ligase|nr:O-antigen ligase family protein [Pyrinomonadaceae bacterium]